MKSPILLLAFSLVFALGVPRSATANLVQDGTFTSVSYSGTLPLTTATFGMFGTSSTVTGATGQTLTLANWSTSGYNYVYSPGTADSGSNTNGANAGQPNQAPGQFNAANGYGDTYLYGPKNGGAATTSGGVGTVEAVPGGGNFIALDGVYETSPVSQTITGLTIGKAYALTFEWAGAQQQSFTGTTTEYLAVSLGGNTVTTGTVTVASQSFSGWMQQTDYFTATSGTETLSFLAGGTPGGEPPFSLVGDVDMELAVIPDFSNWIIFAGFGIACMLFEVVRRKRSQAQFAAAAKMTLTGHARTALFGDAGDPSTLG